MFESLFLLIPAVRTARYDDVMVTADRWLCGFDPSQYIERWNHPWLDEFFFVVYMLYFPMPLVTLTWLFLLRQYQNVERVFFVFLACYYPCYLIYVAVPTAGPHIHLAGEYKVAIEGLWLTMPIRGLLSALEPSKVDAFPSVHTAILLTTMLISWRYQRRVFWWFLPLAVAILWSLLYTRQHYIVDVIAGAVVSIVTAALAFLTLPWLSQGFAPHWPVESA